MTMLLNRKEPVNGVDSKLAKSIAQACSGGWRTLGQIAWQVGCDEDQVALALPALAEGGFVMEREGFWTDTAEGMNELAQARFGKPITREEADALLERTVSRAREYNATEGFPYFIEELRVFGSYLTRKDELGDLDVWIITDERPEFKADRDWRSSHYGIDGSARPRNIVDRLHLGKTELARYLKQRSRKLSLHDQDMSSMVDRWLTVYKRPTQRGERLRLRGRPIR